MQPPEHGRGRRTAGARAAFRDSRLDVREDPPEKPGNRDGAARQLARSGPSVAANYHSAGRSRSRAEFVSRLAIVADEADETEGWLVMLKEAGLTSGAELDWLLAESRELRAIFVKAVKTARANHRH